MGLRGNPRISASTSPAGPRRTGMPSTSMSAGGPGGRLSEPARSTTRRSSRSAAAGESAKAATAASTATAASGHRAEDRTSDVEEAHQAAARTLEALARSVTDILQIGHIDIRHVESTATGIPSIPGTPSEPAANRAAAPHGATAPSPKLPAPRPHVEDVAAETTAGNAFEPIGRWGADSLEFTDPRLCQPKCDGVGKVSIEDRFGLVELLILFDVVQVAPKCLPLRRRFGPGRRLARHRPAQAHHHDRKDDQRGDR